MQHLTGFSVIHQWLFMSQEFCSCDKEICILDRNFETDKGIEFIWHKFVNIQFVPAMGNLLQKEEYYSWHRNVFFVTGIVFMFFKLFFLQEFYSRVRRFLYVNIILWTGIMTGICILWQEIVPVTSIYWLWEESLLVTGNTRFFV